MDNVLIDISFYVIFASIPFLAMELLPYSGVSLRRFSIPSVFIIFYFFSAYVGILPLYFQWDPYRVTLGVVDRTILLKMLLYSGAALIMTILGFIYGRQVIGFNQGGEEYEGLTGANRKQRVFIFFLMLLCGWILVEYIRRIETIALFKVLAGDMKGALEARSRMSNAFEGKYWHFRIFFRTLLDYCVILFFADYLIKRRRISGLVFGVGFLAAAFSATMGIEKGPFIYLLIMIYLAIVVSRGGKYWQPSAKYIAMVMGGSITLFYIYFVGAENIRLLYYGIVGRVFMGQITPAYFYLDLFPRHIDYLWGASFPNPGGILPFHNYKLTMEVASFMFPASFATGIVGSAPTVYWAEIYANFGPIGILFSAFFVGIILFGVSHILSKLRLSPPVLAATVTLAAHYTNLSGTSFSGYLFDTTLIAIATVTFVSLMLDGRRVFIGTGMQQAAETGDAPPHDQ